MVEAIFGPAEDGVQTISTTTAIDILRLIEPTLIMDKENGFDFDWDAAAATLEYLIRQAREPKNVGNVLVIVRKKRRLSRKITDGREAYSDSPYTTQREGVLARQEAIDIPMLMLFRQDGDESLGWRGTPFYWPVIWAQANTKTAVFSHS